jgi:hypothetical protein
VLLVSCERTGAGSVTRLVRLAAGMGGRLDPVLLGPWPAIGLAHQAGLLCEPISDEELNDERLVQRILDTAAVHGVEAIVLDVHRSTTAGRLAAAAGVPLVLIAPQSPSGGGGGVASVVTVRWDDPSRGGEDGGAALRVPSAREEPLTGEAARGMLDLPEGPIALLCPGGDARSIATPRLWPTAQTLLAAGWPVAFAEPLLHGSDIRLPEGVIRVSARPLARYLRAFDVVVAPAGYTLTCELVAAGRPSLLVPFGHDGDRAARAMAAHERGLALAVREFAEAPIVAAAERLGDPAVRAQLTEACAGARMEDGIPRAVDAVERAVRPGRPLDPVGMERGG